MLLTEKAKNELLAIANKATSTMLQEMKAEIISEMTSRNEAYAAEFESKVQTIFENALIADRAKRYESDEPFVEIISQTFSEEGGVQLRLDWNKPFIEYLRKNGFTGPSDEAIVDNWLISLSRERIAEGGSEYK